MESGVYTDPSIVCVCPVQRQMYQSFLETVPMLKSLEVCACACVCVHVHVFVHMCVFVHVCVYVCMHVYSCM